MNEVLVSVILPVFNGEKFITESIDSILNQSFKNFELIIINDGSTDNSYKYIKKFKDNRLLVLNNDKNIGLSNSLNKGLLVAKGKYIARMDQDDISLPDRLIKQVAFMDSNPEIGVCGTWFQTFGEIKKIVTKTPLAHEDIAAIMFSYCPIAHPTVIIRKDIIDRYHFYYDENAHGCEDYKLWVEMVKVTRFANLQEVLLYYRFHGSQFTKLKNNNQDIKNNIAEDFIGRPLTENEKRFHESLHFSTPYFDTKTTSDVIKWVNFLKNLNASKKTYIEPTFSKTLDKVKKNMGRKMFSYSIKNYKRYSPILVFRLFLTEQKYFLYFSFMELSKICIKCFILWPNKNYH